jgi:hypothetical protein
MKEALELLRKYGARDLFFIASIFYLYTATVKQENKIERIEARLYDCYEDRVMIQRNANHKLKIPNPLIAILPNEKTNIRHSRTKREV